MGSLSWWHWLIILAAFILIFGAKKLPDAARGVGRSLRILKSEVSAMQEESKADKQPTETDSTATVATPASQIAASPATATPPAPAATAPAAQPAATPPAADTIVVNGTPVTRDQQQPG